MLRLRTWYARKSAGSPTTCIFAVMAAHRYLVEHEPKPGSEFNDFWCDEHSLSFSNNPRID